MQTSGSRLTDPHTAPRTGAGGRVLLVDDDEGVLKAYARILRELGHEVEALGSGVEAAACLANTRFDVIVCDVHMPAMDGLAVLRFVRERDLDVPVILITGNPSVDAAALAVEHGALRYLIKPIAVPLLERTVVKAIHLHEIARLKRRAMELLGIGDRQVGDLAGLSVRFDSVLRSLWMAYQPVVEWSTKTIFAHEALVRSDEPALPHPGAVLSAAERLDRLPHVGRRIRESVAQTLAESAPTTAFVNLHAHDLLDDQLYARGAPLTQFAPNVVLEITERTSLDNIPDIQRRTAALRDLGYRIAVDDLGAGYAGLTSLAQLEPDIVKLDMSLARNVHLEPKKRTVVASLVELCHKMDMLVVVEGIEIAEERDALVQVGCDLFQGYLFARPGRAFPSVSW